MTEEQFDKLYKILEAMDWKLWEIHTMMKNAFIESEETGDTTDGNNDN